MQPEVWRSQTKTKTVCWVSYLCSLEVDPQGTWLYIPELLKGHLFHFRCSSFPGPTWAPLSSSSSTVIRADVPFSLTVDCRPCQKKQTHFSLPATLMECSPFCRLPTADTQHSRGPGECPISQKKSKHTAHLLFVRTNSKEIAFGQWAEEKSFITGGQVNHTAGEEKNHLSSS